LLALAVLTKGLLAFVVFGAVAATMLWDAEERSRLWRVLVDPVAIAVLLAIALPWHLAAAYRQPGFAWFYFVNEHVLRFLGRREPHDFYEGPWWYYLPRLALGSLPWAVLLVVPGRSREPSDGTQRFLWAWLLAPLVFFSASIAKANYYMVIALPALSLLLGRRLATLDTSRWAALAPAAWLALFAVGAAFGTRASESFRWPAITAAACSSECGVSIR